MTDKKVLRKELILKYPNDSTNELLDKAKNQNISNRRTEFLAEVREIRKLPEPNLAKKEGSIPIKHRTTIQKQRIQKRAKRKAKIKTKPARIPFEQTKFGKMTKSVKTKHRISEKNAIRRVRKLLKLPKKDYLKLNQIDRDILIQYGY